MLNKGGDMLHTKAEQGNEVGGDLRKADKATVTDHVRQEMYEGECNEGFIPYSTFYCGRKFRKL